jgi:hypothetical protein
MKTRIRPSLISILLLLTYGLGDWTGSHRTPRGSRIIIERDVTDISPLLAPSEGQSFCDDYFTKKNAIPDRVR